MSLREELDYVIGRRREYNDAETGRHWEAFASAAYRLIRDHGQALLDALEDAERYRNLRDNSGNQFEHPIVVSQTRRDDSMVYVGPLIGTDLDAAIDTARSKTADQAIDAAIKGDG